MTKTLYWISLPYATFGIETQAGVVVIAAPIAKWTVGKSIEQTLAFYRNKGAIIRYRHVD